jgi:antitoxin (DNA-binding transcriptional repressor) of toxin-antitoxin stability system
MAFGGERVVLTRHGKRVAAVVPIEDLELLESLEDARDLDDVRTALSDPANRDRIGWEELKAQLGLERRPVYAVEFLTSAASALAKVDSAAQRRIAHRIDGLRGEPRPGGAMRRTALQASSPMASPRSAKRTIWVKTKARDPWRLA